MRGAGGEEEVEFPEGVVRGVGVDEEGVEGAVGRVVRTQGGGDGERGGGRDEGCEGGGEGGVDGGVEGGAGEGEGGGGGVGIGGGGGDGGHGWGCCCGRWVGGYFCVDFCVC